MTPSNVAHAIFSLAVFYCQKRDVDAQNVKNIGFAIVTEWEKYSNSTIE